MPPSEAQRRAEYALQFAAAQLVAEGVYDCRPVWKAGMVAGLAVWTAANPDWPMLAPRDAPALEFLRNLMKCGVVVVNSGVNLMN